MRFYVILATILGLAIAFSVRAQETAHPTDMTVTFAKGAYLAEDIELMACRVIQEDRGSQVLFELSRGQRFKRHHGL